MVERWAALIVWSIALLIGVTIGNAVLSHQDATAILQAIEANPHG